MTTESNKPIFTPTEEDIILPAKIGGRNNRWRLKFNLTYVNCFAFLTIIILAAAYLIISNKLVSHGFVVNDVKTDVAGLNKENRELELTAMQMESYNNINEKVAKLGMVSSADVEYLEAKKAEVAMR
ncbi:MAG: hypothetical protein WCV41_02160 [Patescibacteria group bacterium]